MIRLLSTSIFTILFAALLAVAPAHAGIMDDVKAADDERIAAYISGNTAVLDKYLADELVYIHSSGLVDNKKQVIDSFKSGDLKIRKFDREDIKVYQVGSTSIVSAIGHVDATIKGKDVQFDLRYSGVYAKRAGVWQLFHYQGARLPKAE